MYVDSVQEMVDTTDEKRQARLGFRIVGLPTGNWRPALAERGWHFKAESPPTALPPDLPAFPLPPPTRWVYFPFFKRRWKQLIGDGIGITSQFEEKVRIGELTRYTSSNMLGVVALLQETVGTFEMTEGPYIASCYRRLYCQPVQEFWRRDIQERQQNK
jgi:hypothetical protein